VAHVRVVAQPGASSNARARARTGRVTEKADGYFPVQLL
jgi:hypothetical protein